MIVVDASALVASLAPPDRIGDQARGILSMHRKWRVPAHTIVETMQAYRGLLIRERVTQSAAANAIDQLSSLQFEIVAPGPKLIQRTWQLRHNLSAYDAMYVALAEELGCELLTADARIARAKVTKCEVITLPLPDE